MFQFIRRVITALLNRFRPFNPPHDPYAACTGAAPAQSQRPNFRCRARRTGAPNTRARYRCRSSIDRCHSRSVER